MVVNERRLFIILIIIDVIARTFLTPVLSAVFDRLAIKPRASRRLNARFSLNLNFKSEFFRTVDDGRFAACSVAHTRSPCQRIDPSCGSTRAVRERKFQVSAICLKTKNPKISDVLFELNWFPVRLAQNETWIARPRSENVTRRRRVRFESKIRLLTSYRQK